MLLDEVVLEDQGLLLRLRHQVFHVGNLADQGPGFDIPVISPLEIGADPVAEALGLADVDDGPLGVFEEVGPWRFRREPSFALHVHGVHSYGEADLTASPVNSASWSWRILSLNIAALSKSSS